MGWLYMRDCAPWSGPKAYLDNQFTYQTATKASMVLASQIVGNKVYYAACEQVDKVNDAREVFAIVCLINHNPRAADGHTFGYKSMTEHCGPCEAECPETILDEITPTDDERALDWRARCRAYHAKRKARPKPAEGDLLILAQPMRFIDGNTGRRFRVVKHGRRLLFRAPETGTFYRLGKLDQLEWSIVPRAKTE